jgi:Tfp pilus assembly protein PilX
MTRKAQRSARLADSEGYVIIVVMMILLVVTLLVGAAVIGSVSANDLSLRDANAKRAQQAADAGLRMAAFEYNLSALDLFSLSTLRAQVGTCVTGSTAAGVGVVTKSTSPSPPWCDPVVQDLGNGESYSYVASPATQILHQTGVQHTGLCLPILGCTGPDITTYSTQVERIVVATGTAGSVTRRVAERVKLTGTATTESCSGIVGCVLDLVLSVLGVNPGASGTTTGASITQSYAVEPNSYRQCPASPPSGPDPSSNCSLGPTGIS